MTRRRHAARPLVATLALALVALAGPGGASGALAATADATDRYRHDLDLRYELGFRNDVEFVRSLHDARAAGAYVNDDVLDIPLTDAERAELLVRDGLGRIDASAVRAAFEGRTDFGGVFVDNRNGGLLHVQTTGDPVLIADLLRPRLARPDRLYVSRVAQSYRQLLEAKAAVDARVETLRGSGVRVTGIGIDETRNAVRVHLAADTVANRQAVRAVLPATANVTFGERAPSVWTGGNVANSLPFRGGQSIRPSFTATPDFTCSIGFVAYQTLVDGSRVPAVLSAGHCASRDDIQQAFTGSWYQYNQLIGTASSNSMPFQYGGATIADAMRVPITTGVSNDVLGANYQVFDITGWEGQYDGPVGQTVCNNGASSYRVCGTLTDINYTIVYGDDPGENKAYNGNNIRVDYLRVSTATSKRGDSGGAVTHTAGAHYAAGIVHGALQCPTNLTYCTEMTYTHIYNALRAVGLSGVYTS